MSGTLIITAQIYNVSQRQIRDHRQISIARLCMMARAEQQPLFHSASAAHSITAVIPEVVDGICWKKWRAIRAVFHAADRGSMTGAEQARLAQIYGPLLRSGLSGNYRRVW